MKEVFVLMEVASGRSASWTNVVAVFTERDLADRAATVAGYEVVVSQLFESEEDASVFLFESSEQKRVEAEKWLISS